jgi:hypothetical protein
MRPYRIVSLVSREAADSWTCDRAGRATAVVKSTVVVVERT